MCCIEVFVIEFRSSALRQADKRMARKRQGEDKLTEPRGEDAPATAGKRPKNPPGAATTKEPTAKVSRSAQARKEEKLSMDGSEKATRAQAARPEDQPLKFDQKVTVDAMRRLGLRIDTADSELGPSGEAATAADGLAKTELDEESDFETLSSPSPAYEGDRVLFKVQYSKTRDVTRTITDDVTTAMLAGAVTSGAGPISEGTAEHLASVFKKTRSQFEATLESLPLDEAGPVAPTRQREKQTVSAMSHGSHAQHWGGCSDDASSDEPGPVAPTRQRESSGGSHASLVENAVEKMPDESLGEADRAEPICSTGFGSLVTGTQLEELFGPGQTDETMASPQKASRSEPGLLSSVPLGMGMTVRKFREDDQAPEAAKELPYSHDNHHPREFFNLARIF